MAVKLISLRDSRRGTSRLRGLEAWRLGELDDGLNYSVFTWLQGGMAAQALLDLFTILKYYPKYPNKIAFSGDIKYSRTIHSLVYLLNKLCPDIEFYFVCDKLLEPSNELLSSLKKFKICNDLDYIIKFIDVLYVTRLQKERFNGEIIKSYIIDENLIKNSKSKLIILHPLPRNEELSKDLDNNPKSKYFEQVENGIYVRMSIIFNLFE